MQALKSQVTQRAGCLLLSALLAFPSFALAQDQTAPPPPAPSADSQGVPAPPPPAVTGGWKRVGDQNSTPQNSPDVQAQPAPAANDAPAPAPPPPPTAAAGEVNGQPNGYPTYGGQQPQAGPNYGPPAYPQSQGGGYTQGPPPQGYPQQQPNYQQTPPPPVPATLTMPAGTYLTVRINQMLSSDKNQVGDAFSATLAKPVVVNGIVVAEPGQTIGGHVVEAVKAGHVSGLARLGVQLTDLTLVDGQTLPIKSSLISRTGPSSVGQDAGAIVGTTALGAAVGAAAAWGKGAAIGAGSGLVLGTIGVLVTRGHPSILFPEQMLTFRVEAPVTIATDHAPQAFRYVEPGEYSQSGYGPPAPYAQYTAAPYAAYPPAVAPAPYYYGYPYPYYAYGYPYYWGPGFSLFLGGRYYYGGGYRYYGGPIGRVGIGGRVGGGRR